MGGSGFFRNFVGGSFGLEGLEDFLKGALRVDFLGIVDHSVELGASFTEEETAGGLEATIHVNRPDNAFEGVGQCGRPVAAAAGFLAPSHHEVVAEPQFAREDAERGTGDESGAQFGQAAFAEIREQAEEVLGDDQLDDGVAEELQALVVKCVGLALKRNAGVCQRLRKQQGVAELVSQPSLQRVHHFGRPAARVVIRHGQMVSLPVAREAGRRHLSKMRCFRASDNFKVFTITHLTRSGRRGGLGDMDGNTEVLIVGAGPVGLTLAIECARHDVAFRIFDAAPLPSDKSKALAIWSAAQEVFAAAGVVDRMLAEGLKPEGIRVCSRSRLLADVSFAGRVDSPYPDPLILPQSHTEKILIERLSELGHTVERPREWMTAREQDGAWVSTIRGPDGAEYEIASRFLAGCDGAHSAVRHFVGATFHGQAVAENFVLCDVEISSDRPIPPCVHLFVSRRGPLPVFPIRERVWRIVSSRGPGEGAAPPTIEEMQDHVDARGPGGWKLSNAEWLACFKVSERKVERFRHGNIFLAGDAAHIHSPAGGQGMNTGVQDAFNLAWKLGAILRQGASADALLESYHAERSPVAAEVIAKAGFRMRAAVLSRGPLAILRNALAALAGRSDKARAMLVSSLSGTGIRYPAGPAVMRDDRWHEDWMNHGFPPGVRIRDAKVFSDDLEVSLLHEVMQTRRHTLLLFSGRKPNYRDADLLDGLRMEAANATTLMTSLAVWEGGHAPDDSWLTDPDGSAHRRFGVDQPAACIVRPDGVVMARSQPAVAALVTEVLQRLGGS